MSDDRQRRSLADDRGSGYMAAFLVLFAILATGGIALIADSSRIFAAQRTASGVAFESARAAAQSVDDSSLRSPAAPQIDAATAAATARRVADELLNGSNGRVTRVEVRTDEVVVTITSHVDHWFPGVSDATITETGRARLAVGITEEGQ